MTDIVKPGPNKRVCAYFIDLFFVSIVNTGLVLAGLKGYEWVLPTVYFLGRDMMGQSLGKMAVGLKVMGTDGEAVTAPASIMRNVLLTAASMSTYLHPWAVVLFVAVYLAEYFVILRNPEGKRIGDMIGKTKVIDLKPQLKDDLFLWISIGLVLLWWAAGTIAL